MIIRVYIVCFVDWGEHDIHGVYVDKRVAEAKVQELEAKYRAKHQQYADTCPYFIIEENEVTV